MAFVADALWQIKMKKYRLAADMLSEHVNDPNLKQVSKIGLMEWVANCYWNCEDHSLAAKWYETAGKSALECTEIEGFERKRKAIQYLERSQDCYELCHDFDGIRRVVEMKHSLSPSF